MELKNARRVIRRACGTCGKQLGFAPMTEEYVRLADAADTGTSPLAVLARAQQLGVRLVNNGLVVSIHPQDWRRADEDFRTSLRACRHSLAKLLGQQGAGR
jgi:hypothetical protein